MDGTRLPASYANFYIGNVAVLLPLYDQSSDRHAVQILKKLFPKKKIAAIQCSSLVYGLGSIHCVTQQQPA
jgi:agmatine deiminase